MFERLGSVTYRFRYLIVLAWIVVGGLMVVFAPSLAGAGSTDQTSFLPASAPSVAARDAIERAFPGSTANSSATITLYRATGLTDTDRQYRDAFAAWIKSDQAPAELRGAVTDTETADSRPELETLLRSADGTFEMMVVNLNVASAGDAAALVVRQLRDGLRGATPAGLEAHVTGAAAISSDYLDAIRAGTESTTLITVILVVLVLLAIYRAPLAALIPLVTIGGAWLVARGILGILAATGWQVSSLLETFVVVLVFGVGTDYAIFLISRYREEVRRGDWHDAARITVGRIGAVISASAGTVMVGLLALGAGEFRMLSTIGPGLAIAVGMTLLAGLTLTPALLSIFGHYLFWPRHTRQGADDEPRGFFAGLATFVSRWPGLVTGALLALLLIPALFVPQAKQNFDVISDLPPSADSRLGYDAISAHLGEDKLVQSTALIDTGSTDVLAPASLAKLHQVLVALHQINGIATTTSIVTPDGDTTIPDGFRPSVTLQDIADGFESDESISGDTAALLDSEVENGLNQALDYVNGVSVAFPDVGARTETRAVRGGLEDALDVVTRARAQSVLSTQLRTLAAQITDPANAASSGSGSGSSVMSDYLAELADAYPEVRTLPAYQQAVRAADQLRAEASISAALDLADGLNLLADHFDGRPDATLSPESLADLPSVKEQRAEAERIFNALPGQLSALAGVYAARPDDIWIPTTLGGDDGQKINDAIDAFVSADHGATRFYITSSNDPYSGGAFAVVGQARTLLSSEAPRFGAGASAHVGGATAQFADVQDTLSRDFAKVGVITVIGILLVLMVLLRAIVAPLYLVGTVLVSYASAIGISVVLFQDVMGQAGVSPYLPLILFVLLVALGSDYNIFLMQRVREEAAGRSIRDAVRIASGYTGAVITSAGLVLAGTFLSMVTAPVMILFQVGIAVAVGVLIDTFLVRSILVPAITALVGDRAWWPSSYLLSGLLRRVPVPVPARAASPASASPTARRSRARFALALALAVLLPSAAAGVLTWSFGTASGNLTSVTAAVVNLDQGASMPGADGTPQDLALGSDVATALTTGREPGFSWVATDAASAARGLADGGYAAVLTVPADFSRSVAAIRADTTGSAPQATLGVATSDSSGYTLRSIARAVAAAIATSTAHGVTASYVDDVLVRVTTARSDLAAGAADASALADDAAALAADVSGTGAIAETVSSGLRELADGMTSAADGTQQLVDATRRLADGTDTLSSGAGLLADGAHAARDGARQLNSGAADLAGGMSTLADQTADLPHQAQLLAEGARGMKTGTSGVADGAQQLADGLGLMAGQTTGMGAGAVALDAGAGSLEQGARDLRDGADLTAAGATDLAAGAADLSSGIDSYTGGVDLLAANCVAMGGGPVVCGQLVAIAAGSAELRSGADDVASGAGQVSGGVQSLADGMDGIVDGADGVHTGTSQLAANLPQLEAGIADSAAGAAELAGGAATVAAGAQQLATGTQQFADGAPALADGIDRLSSGAAALSDGMKTYAGRMDDLVDGADDLASGAEQTASGAGQLADGVATSADGLDQLKSAMTTAADSAALVEQQINNLVGDGNDLSDSATALSDRLDASAASFADYDAQTRSAVSDLAADPVTVDLSGVSDTNAESGFAPYFMALAAWLGVLGAFLVVPALWPRNDRRWWLAALRSFGIAGSVAVIGAVLVVPVLALLLGVPIANVGGLVGFAVLAALAFTAIVQALVALFGMRGWLVALLLLVLGIAASGLGMDAAAVPGPLSAIRPLLPLSYAIDAFRDAITGSGGALLMGAIMLAVFLVTSVMVTLATAAATGRRSDDVAPAGV